jgi:hypothetical protein
MKNLLLSLLFIVLFAAGLTAQVTVAWTAPYQSPSQLVDYGREIKTDAQGNVYVGGHSIVDAQQHAVVTILKYDNNGNFLWEYHSPDVNYNMEDMEVDSSGNVYYAGERWIPVSSEWNYLTVKLDSSGNLIWAVQYDGNGIGSGLDYGWALALDDSCNVYVTGQSQGTFNGYDLVTVKYDSSGQQKWVARYVNPDNASLSSNYFNEAFEVLTDQNRNVYVSGYFFNGTSHELTLLKYDAAGNFLWERDMDTKAQWTTVQKNYMKLDASDDIYLLGNIQDSLTGCDLLLLKYDATGTLLWSQTWNSPGNDSDYVCGTYYTDEGLAIDNNGNAFVSGTISNPSISFQEDIVTLKYSPAGNLLWTDIFNGPGNDEDRPLSIAVDQAGNAYVCGSSFHSSALVAQDYVTFKLNGTTGVHEWNQFYNGPADADDVAHAISVDAQQNVYITGLSMVNADPFDLHAQIVTIKYSQVATGIGENENNLSWNVYPNPVSDNLKITFDPKGKNNARAISLFNVLGKKVFEKIIPAHVNELAINVKSFKPGVYFLRMGDTANKIIIVK